MRFFSFIFLFVFLCVSGAHGQVVENTIDGGREDLSVASQGVDGDGNTYLLINQSIHYAGKGILVEGSWNGLELYKLDTAGKVIWHQSLGRSGLIGDICVADTTLFVPIATHGFRVNDGGHGYAPASINGGIILNKISGSIITNRCFRSAQNLKTRDPSYESDSDDHTGHVLAFQRNDNTISYINGRVEILARFEDKINPHWMHEITKTHLIDERRDSAMVYLGTKEVCALNYLYKDRIAYDRYADEFVIADSAGLYIYSSDWRLLRTIALPHLSEFSMPYYRISMNSDYYVLNYGSDFYAHDRKDFYTLVFTKKGKEVSCRNSPYYASLVIDDKNTIYAIPKRERDSVHEAITLVAMNIHQKATHEKYIGPSYTDACGISFDNKHNLVITGTCHIPDPAPNITERTHIYFYRETAQ